MLREIGKRLALRRRQPSPDDAAARREQKHVEDDVATTRVLGRFGPRAFTSDRRWRS